MQILFTRTESHRDCALIESKMRGSHSCGDFGVRPKFPLDTAEARRCNEIRDAHQTNISIKRQEEMTKPISPELVK
jgi:hypothetical protein